MSGVLLWGWDPTNKVWVPIKVSPAGSLYIVETVDSLNDIGDVSVAAPTDGYILYWDAGTSLWKAKAIPAAAWAVITGKPTAPSVEELATEHDAAGLHTGVIVLADADIPAAIARDAEVTADIATHAAIAAAHHAKYTDAEAKAAAVLAGAITDAETKAPTHDAVFDVKTTADGAIPKSLLTERGSVIFRNATVPAELLHGTAGQVLQSGGHGADPAWAAPGGAGIWRTLSDQVVSGAAVTEIAVTGLNLATDKLWQLHVVLKNPTAGSLYYYLYFNADETNTNYYLQYFSCENTAIVAARENHPGAGYLLAGDEGFTDIWIKRTPDGYTYANCLWCCKDPSAIALINKCIAWNSTANVTALKIKCSAASGIAIGSALILLGFVP